MGVLRGMIMMSLRVSGGRYKGRTLRVAPGSTTRPSSQVVRAALFSIISPQIENAKVLDLFAGTGSLGIEALSRGALKAHFVENNHKQFIALNKNLENFSLANETKVFPVSVEKALDTFTETYDVVFLDPPYDYPGVDNLVVKIIKSKILVENGTIILEHSRRVSAPKELPDVRLVKEKTYGDTQISIYEKVGSVC